MGYKVAVVGATGAVGREILKTLAERDFPADEVVAVASERSAGQEVSFGEDAVLTIQNLKTYNFTGTDIVLMSAGGTISKEWSPKIAAQGAVVIDNSSQWRMDPDCPLVVPEVNAHALAGYAKKNIIGNPNCSTAQLVVALKPLHEKYKIKRVVVATYQSASGAGKSGMDELFNQTRGIYVNDRPQPEKFTKQIAFNVIPHIGPFMDDGSTHEEWKMTEETKKMLDPAIEMTAFCVRVPVFIGHSEAVWIETEEPIDEAEARQAMEAQEGLVVVDHRVDEGYVTPVECAGEDPVYISRIRKDPTVANGLAFWCVSDNLRKGAALNSVQIAEALVDLHLSKRAA